MRYGILHLVKFYDLPLLCREEEHLSIQPGDTIQSIIIFSWNINITMHQNHQLPKPFE
jgi:hypothetical protein